VSGLLVSASLLTACSESVNDETRQQSQPQLHAIASALNAQQTVHGETMGTRWQAIWSVAEGTVAKDKSNTTPISAQIEQAIIDELERINKLMSTWDPTSQLSLFNQSDSIEPVVLHNDTLAVIDAARRFSQLTQGRYDITLAPVIKLWGFDASKPVQSPSDQELSEALTKSGSRQLVRVANTIRKRHPHVSVDVSSLAKGYAVDKLGELLESLGISSYLVEIGGEIRTRGARADGSAWQVGIENPNAQWLDGLLLNNAHIASSGSYRNFRIENGQRLSHIIDGATGKPVTHSLVAVTVLADSTMLADAWATVLMVVGEQAAQKLISQHMLTARLVVYESGEFRTIQTPSFTRLLLEVP